MNKSFVLRPVCDDDQVFLDALYVSSREDLQFPGAEPDFVLRIIKMQQKAQANGFEQLYPQAKHWVIQKADSAEAIGRAVIDDGENGLRLVDIAVLPQHRRSGAGRFVLLTLQQEASAGQRDVRLAVSLTNHAARQLYLSLGFGIEKADELFEQMLWRSFSSKNE